MSKNVFEHIHRIRHYSGTVHAAKKDEDFRGQHYRFLCHNWTNLDYEEPYQKADSKETVTCKKCLRIYKLRMVSPIWEVPEPW